MKKILITGASGFIGANFTRRLVKEKKNVSILIRRKSNLWRINDIVSNVNKHVVDLENYSEINKVIEKIKPNIIFNLASYVVIETLVRTNMVGSVNLMKASCNSQSLERFVNIGSSFEYEIGKKSVKESDKIEPFSPYSMTKIAQGFFAKYFHETKNLPIVTLRLFTSYGPYEEPGRLVTDIMLSILKKRILKISNPFTKRDFIYMDDTLDALEKAAFVPHIEGKIFNIGSGKTFSVEQIVKTAISSIGKDVMVSTKTTEKKRVESRIVDGPANIQKAKKILKWSPKYNLQNGLLKTYRWYEKNLELYNNN
jgi:nucleoside-diphosphate-sugar epimerase